MMDVFGHKITTEKVKTLISSTGYMHRCSKCGKVWLYRKPEQIGVECPGVPVYQSLKKANKQELFSKTQLSEMGYSIGKSLPAPEAATYNMPGHRWTFLYDPAKCTRKRELTPKQKQHLEKLNHDNSMIYSFFCDKCGTYLDYEKRRRRIAEKQKLQCFMCHDRNLAIDEAVEIMSNPNKYVILDSETTGLRNADAVQLSIIDLSGSTLIDTLVKTDKPIEYGALQVHGISQDMIQDAPTAEALHSKITDIVANKTVLIYNSDFDEPIIKRQFNIDLETNCVMHLYAQFFGEYNSYWQSYTWQKLPGGDHSALGDCKATLDVLKEMATAEKRDPVLNLEKL